MTPLAAYLLLFVAVGIGFIFVHLMAGKFIRPNKPDPAKGTIYECGEPTIGSAWVQFDLRFYVVALLFVIFDVEMAFFFPWAVVFGKTNELARDTMTLEQREQTAKLLDRAMPARLAELDQKIAERDVNKAEFQKQLDAVNAQLARPGLDNPGRQQLEDTRDSLKGQILRLDMLPRQREDLIAKTKEPSGKFGWVAFLDILVFFGVLLVGFAYLWRRGDINWVRSTAAQEAPPTAKTEESGRAPLATVV